MLSTAAGGGIDSEKKTRAQVGLSLSVMHFISPRMYLNCSEERELVHCYNSCFASECSLLAFDFLFVLDLCILLDQTITFHILFNVIP